MGQFEICELLKNYKKPLPRFMIARLLNEDPNKVSKLLNKLLDHNEIKCIEIDRIEAKKLFGDNSPYRRLRLYYLCIE